MQKRDKTQDIGPLERYRRAQKLTFRTLAAACGVSTSHAERLCSGRVRFLDPWLLVRIQGATGVDAVDYIDWVRTRHPERGAA